MRHPSKSELVLLLLIGVAACASSPAPLPEGQSTSREAPVAIFVAGHGWHTGLIVPAADLQARLPGLETRFGAPPYFEIGWGDRDFYQAETITLGTALKAVLWPTEAVMHVAAVPSDVAAYFPHSEIHRLCLPPGRYEALLDFIAGSFRRSAGSAITPGGRGLYGDSSFYAAVGSYTLFNTCNTWTAKGLRQAGLDIGTTFKATASSVMKCLRRRDGSREEGCPPEARTGAGRRFDDCRESAVLITELSFPDLTWESS
jgi:uncharacterized protein (TIGR02117 family)